MGAEAAPAKPLTGLVEAGRVHGRPEQIPDDAIQRLRAIADLTATLSDVLDMLGLEGAVGASRLVATQPDTTIVGTAVTVRKAPQRRAPVAGAGAGEADMGEIEGANQAKAGDVLVIQGLQGVSAMGGLMSTMAKRQGAIGAVVDGGIRDLGRARSLDFPIWSSEVTPVTGKWRSEVVEVNGAVSIAERSVQAGDLVVADETGVVFVPAGLVSEAVERVEAIARAEEGYIAALAGDLPLPELVKAYRGENPG